MNLAARSLCVAIENRLPIALRGRPGVGKTSMVEAIAHDLGLHLEVVIGSLREPTDFAGLPIVRPDGAIDLASPRWAIRANDANEGAIVLFDELTTASPAVQAAMLRVIRERVVGDLRLADHVRIVAAYNDSSDCGGYDLELPMRSRFIHLLIEPELEQFCMGLLHGWSSLANHGFPEPSLVRHWRALVAGFLRARPGLLELTPESGSTGGYPNPRTWELLVYAAEAVDRSGENDDVRSLLFAGCVGPGAAAEFHSFIENLDLPNPAELLESPEQFAAYLDPLRPDRVLLILQAVANCADIDGVGDRWTNSWRIAEMAVEAGFADLVVWTYREVARRRPDGTAIPPSFKAIREFIERAA